MSFFNLDGFSTLLAQRWVLVVIVESFLTKFLGCNLSAFTSVKASLNLFLIYGKIGRIYFW